MTKFSSASPLIIPSNFSRTFSELNLAPVSARGLGSLEAKRQNSRLFLLLRHVVFISKVAGKISKSSLQCCYNDLMSDNLFKKDLSSIEQIERCLDVSEDKIKELFEFLSQNRPTLSEFSPTSVQKWRQNLAFKTSGQLESMNDDDKLTLILDCLYGLASELLLLRQENSKLGARGDLMLAKSQTNQR
ncbi:hypothetical protein GEMRC1_004027 [Eukaryota sp. GEM-RC1]